MSSGCSRGGRRRTTAEPAGALAGARADPATLRALTFVAGDITIEVEVTADAVQGHLVPVRSGEIEMQLRDGSTYAGPVDHDGWFLFTTRPAGTMRLRLHLAEAGTTLTPWTSL